MSIKHTPGPWTYNTKTDCILSLHVDYNYSMSAKIATGENRAEENANAALIAAAPELLEACKNLLSLFDSGWAVRDTSDDASPGFALRQIEPMRKLSFAKSAIAKAETI